MLYLDGNGKLQITENPGEIAFYKLLQELNLYKGECPINTSAGVDYISILAGEAFLKAELQNVLDKHVMNFESLTLSEPSTDGEQVSINIIAFGKDGSALPIATITL